MVILNCEYLVLRMPGLVEHYIKLKIIESPTNVHDKFSNRLISSGEIDGNMWKKSFFSTDIDVDNSFNHLEKIEIATMGPVSNFSR